MSGKIFDAVTGELSNSKLKKLLDETINPSIVSNSRAERQKYARLVYSQKSFSKVSTKRAWSSRKFIDECREKSLFTKSPDIQYKSTFNSNGPGDYDIPPPEVLSRFSNTPSYTLRPILQKGTEILQETGKDVPPAIGPGRYDPDFSKILRNAPATTQAKSKRFQDVYHHDRLMRRIPHTYN